MQLSDLHSEPRRRGRTHSGVSREVTGRTFCGPSASLCEFLDLLSGKLGGRSSPQLTGSGHSNLNFLETQPVHPGNGNHVCTQETEITCAPKKRKSRCLPAPQRGLEDPALLGRPSTITQQAVQCGMWQESAACQFPSFPLRCRRKRCMLVLCYAVWPNDLNN